jgi:hypothetical protein
LKLKSVSDPVIHFEARAKWGGDAVEGSRDKDLGHPHVLVLVDEVLNERIEALSHHFLGNFLAKKVNAILSESPVEPIEKCVETLAGPLIHDRETWKLTEDT